MKSSYRCLKIGASLMDGMTASLNAKHQKKEWIPCLWSQSGSQKGKPWQHFRSAIAGNEELENLVHGFQLSEEEAKEPTVILRHLQEHFMASEGV